MGELGLNKIFGALLAVGLTIMGLRELSAIVFGGGHHGSYEYESANAWAESNFKGYRITIPEVGGAADVVEVIYDLGALLLAADAEKGERSFKAKCASCHTIEQGGANGTGPNLYGVVGDKKQHLDNFNYSGALASVGGVWTWQNMDEWLKAPSTYARGNSMAFAGLKRDDERANVLAYLASYTPDAPPMPEPLPPAEDAVDGEAVETAVDAGTLATDPTEATGEIVVQDATAGDGVELITEAAAEAVEEAAAEVEADVEETVSAPSEE